MFDLTNTRPKHDQYKWIRVEIECTFFINNTKHWGNRTVVAAATIVSMASAKKAQQNVFTLYHSYSRTILLGFIWILDFHFKIVLVPALSTGQVRQKCRATLVIPPGTTVATIVTICCNHPGGEYFLHLITRKLGSTATSTVITRLPLLTNYISGAENETQRAFLGHTNGNIEMLSPSA